MANKNVPQIRFKGFDGEWEEKSIGELSTIKGRIGFRGYTRADLVSYEKGAITLSPGDINDGILDFSDCTYISWDKYYESPEIMIEENDVIFCKTASIGKTAIVKNMPTKCTINPQLVVFKKIKGNHDFFGLILKTDRIQKGTIEQMGMGSIPNISQKKIESLEAKFPSSSEQTRIASLFTSLDKQISCSEAKLDKLRTIKNTLLKKMFVAPREKTPEIRFKGFDGEWEEKRFSNFTYPSGKKNKDNLPLESYSITNENGFVPQNEKFEKGGNMATADKSMYYIVEKNSFAYNPARINVGSIGYYNKEKDVIVSSLYEVFKTTEDVNDRFLWHWLKSDFFNKKIEQLQEGGVRLYFYYDKLCMCSLYMPTSKEQEKIACCIDSLDKQISLQEQKIEKLKAVKKTLLKKMFV